MYLYYKVLLVPINAVFRGTMMYQICTPCRGPSPESITTTVQYYLMDECIEYLRSYINLPTTFKPMTRIQP